LVAGEIDAAQIDVELRLRLRQIFRQKHDVGSPLAEASFDVDAQLLGHETDLALVDQQALRVGMAGGEQERPERRDKRTQQDHHPMLPFGRVRGSMRMSAASRSTKWCLSAAAVCTQTSMNRAKFNARCAPLRTPASALSVGTRSGNGTR